MSVPVLSASAMEAKEDTPFLSSSHDEKRGSLSPFSPLGDWGPGENPFEYKTPLGRCGAVLLVLCIPLALVRLLLIISTMVLIWIVSAIATCGHRKEDEEGRALPLSSCRRCLFAPVPWLVRLVLFFFGFNWISVFEWRKVMTADLEKGGGSEKPNRRPYEWIRRRVWCCTPSVSAPIAASNHVSVFDFMVVEAMLDPMFLAHAGVATTPLIGSVARGMQTLFVKRDDKKSRSQVVKQIIARVRAIEAGEFAKPLLIFPEGTTSNDDNFTWFKNGAFYPNAPVQPVYIRYPSCGFSLAWVPGGPSDGMLAFRALCQLHNSCEIHFLPPYEPGELEKAHTTTFATNFRAYMAEPFGVRLTKHSFEDVRLLEAVRDTGYVAKNVTGVISGSLMKKMLGFSLKQCAQLVKHFHEYDTDSDGLLSRTEFEKGMKKMGFQNINFDHFYEVFDRDGNGELDFREIVMGLMVCNDIGRSGKGGKEAMSLAFMVYDLDGNGLLSRAEFEKIYSNVLQYGAGSSQPNLSVEADFVSVEEALFPPGKDAVTEAEFLDFAKENPSVLSALKIVQRRFSI